MTSMRSFALTPGRIILLIVLCLLAAVAAFLAYLPATWVWSQLKAEVVLPPELSVEAVGGTIWSGASLLSVRAPGLPPKTLRFAWDVDLPALDGIWPLEWPFEWRLESRQSLLEGQLYLRGLDRMDVVIDHGLIALTEFSEIARQNGLTLPGSITLSNLYFKLEQNALVDAGGRGRWGGGPVSWRVGDQRGNANLPAMMADLQDQSGGLALEITTEDASEPLIDLAVTPDGIMNMAVRRRLPELSGMAAGSGSPTDTVFRVQSRVFP